VASWQATYEKLEIKEKHISEMKQKIPELLAELDMKTREKNQYKTSSKRYESELNKRKEQLNDVIIIPQEGSLAAALGMAIDPAPKAAPIREGTMKSSPSLAEPIRRRRIWLIRSWQILARRLTMVQARTILSVSTMPLCIDHLFFLVLLGG